MGILLLVQKLAVALQKEKPIEKCFISLHDLDFEHFYIKVLKNSCVAFPQSLSHQGSENGNDAFSASTVIEVSAA